MQTSAWPDSQVQPLSERTFELFRKLIHDETGIYMRECKKVLVSNRLRKRLLGLRQRSYDDYYRYLTESEHRQEELSHFIAAVSTNETYFFRESNHFEALRKVILPRLHRGKSKLRVWSAGCSSGEEAYTLKIVIGETLAALGGAKVEITATDISAEMIAKARANILEFIKKSWVLNRWPKCRNLLHLVLQGKKGRRNFQQRLLWRLSRFMGCLLPKTAHRGTNRGWNGA